MDKRVRRTKKSLKEAMISLLKEENFETITVTEICEKAMISRNTFYNYYNDKYALLEDCFRDYSLVFEQHFEFLQKANNPSAEVQQGFMNMMDTFLDTESLYAAIPMLSSFDLMALYYNAIMSILEKYEEKYSPSISAAYDMKQINSFLVLGFWGFIHSNQKIDRETVKKNARMLMLDLLASPIFAVNQGKHAGL